MSLPIPSRRTATPLALVLLSVFPATNAGHIRSGSGSGNATTSSARELTTAGFNADYDILAEFKNRNLLSDAYSKMPMQWSAQVPEVSFGGSVRAISLNEVDPLPSVFSEGAQFYLDGQLQPYLPPNVLYQSTRDEDVWIVKGTSTMAIRTDPKTGDTAVLLPMDTDLNVYTEVTTSDMDTEKLARFHFEQDNAQSPNARLLQEFLPEESRQFRQSIKPNPPVCQDFRVIEVAIAYESRFCEFMGGSTRANEVVQLTVARASQKFQRSSLCAKLQLKHVEGFCDPKKDPYSKMFSGSVCSLDDDKSILSLFRDYWVRNRSFVKRDVAHLFHGFDHASGTVGCAWQAALCDNDWGYGVNELTFGGNNNPHFWSVLFAHELGHSAGAPHGRAYSKSLMDPIMCWDCDTFSDESSAYIRLHMDQVGACLPYESAFNTLISNNDGDLQHDVIVDTTPESDDNGGGWDGDVCGDRLQYCNLQPCCQPFTCYNRFICL